MTKLSNGIVHVLGETLNHVALTKLFVFWCAVVVAHVVKCRLTNDRMTGASCAA
jgi:hypothetical protein